MTLGTRIRTLRKSLGLTQQGLADKTKVSRIYIQALESGRRTPSMKLLARLAESLEVEMQDLVKSLSSSSSGRVHLEEVFQAPPTTEIWYRRKKLEPRELRFVQSLVDAAVSRWEEEDAEKDQ
ncbi:MAG: helix-turn-helix transcriptional regulator [Synergistaceae bacterium]|nr:helix-turn-helix transcriptional regulator [Synergistota bacterium]NLM72037.1 helix-turn-helix transcriptional regulator [Synergistaceae bacterium]